MAILSYLPVLCTYCKIIYACSIINAMSTFVIEDYMLDRHSCQIYCPLENEVIIIITMSSLWACKNSGERSLSGYDQM